MKQQRWVTNHSYDPTNSITSSLHGQGDMAVLPTSVWKIFSTYLQAERQWQTNKLWELHNDENSKEELWEFRGGKVEHNIMHSTLLSWPNSTNIYRKHDVLTEVNTWSTVTGLIILTVHTLGLRGVLLKTADSLISGFVIHLTFYWQPEFTKFC